MPRAADRAAVEAGGASESAFPQCRWRASRSVAILAALMLGGGTVGNVRTLAAQQACAATRSGAADGSIAEPFPGYDDYVRHALSKWHVPGAAVAVVRNDTVLYVKGYGVRTAGAPEPVDAHTLFAIGSTTKAFTATGIAMMIAEGKMRWDAPITGYLPSFQTSNAYMTHELTLRDALSHRSGLAQDEMPWLGSGFTREEVIRRIRFQPFTSGLRERYQYQNVMFVVAGEALARVAGTSWDAFVRERFFEPLGMRESNTSITALAGRENVVTPHVGSGARVRRVPWRNIDNAGPAGSINSSASDMAQWLRLQTGGGVIGGCRVFTEALAREMLSPQTILNGEPAGLLDYLQPPSPFKTYGLGWHLQEYRGDVLAEHSGGIDGMTALLAIVPARRVGVIFLANLQNAPAASAVVYRTIDLLLGRPVRDWTADVERRLAALEKEQSGSTGGARARVPGTKPSLPLQGYAGTYADSLYGDVRVMLQNDTLRFVRGADWSGAMAHWHYDTFRVVWDLGHMGADPATFTFGPHGAVSGLTVRSLGSTMHFGRRQAPASAR